MRISTNPRPCNVLCFYLLCPLNIITCPREGLIPLRDSQLMFLKFSQHRNTLHCDSASRQKSIIKDSLQLLNLFEKEFCVTFSVATFKNL